MTQSTKRIGVVLALVAMACFGAWPFYKYFNRQAASAALQARTKALVDAKPELQLAWTIALQDDVLTQDEAKVIVEGAGEKLAPEE